jgi:hypothetical protein
MKELSMFVRCKECFGIHYQNESIETKNIEEDPYTGADVLTFVCPYTNHVTSSVILVENQ